LTGSFEGYMDPYNYQSRQIQYTDWKRWRKLSEVALQRFCAKGLAEAATFAEGPDSAHSRYRKLFAHMRSFDDKVAAVFNDQRSPTPISKSPQRSPKEQSNATSWPNSAPRPKRLYVSCSTRSNATFSFVMQWPR